METSFQAQSLKLRICVAWIYPKLYVLSPLPELSQVSVQRHQLNYATEIASPQAQTSLIRKIL